MRGTSRGHDAERYQLTKAIRRYAADRTNFHHRVRLRLHHDLAVMEVLVPAQIPNAARGLKDDSAARSRYQAFAWSLTTVGSAIVSDRY